MSVKIKDIAKLTGLSMSTISKALNNASDISEHTRALVIQEALKLGYDTNQLKSASQNKMVILIGSMQYDSMEHFAYEVIMGFKTAAMKKGIIVDIEPVTLGKEPFHDYNAYMMENGYRAAFVMGFSFRNQYAQQLRSTKFPTVLLDNTVDNDKVAWVGTDNAEGIIKAIEFLYDKNHRNIALLNGGQFSRVTQERKEAYHYTMYTKGLPVKECFIGQGDYTSECAQNFVQSFLDNGATAILCANDRMAFGVMEELRRLGKEIPGDVSVMGYDDLPFAAYTFPALTTVRQNRKDIGESAFVVLQQLVKGLKIRRLLLRPEVIVRESVGENKNYTNFV